MKLLEKQIEDVFEQFYTELIEPDLVFQGRQVILENKLRIDLLFKDVNNKNVIVELKKDSISREDVGQILQYAGTIDNSRVILIAPHIASSYKKSFEHYGIEYIEFNSLKIQKLFSKLSEKSREIEKNELPVFEEVIKEPLPEKRIIDGNIAFKVSYNDRNWAGICSPKIYQENSFGKHKMFWCNEQHNRLNTVKCQDWNDNELDINNFPCYDSVANKILGFSPGWNHGKNKPHVCLNAKVGKIAFLTSLEPGLPQSERFIFTIFQIEKIIPKQDNGYEYYYGNNKTAIKLSPDQYLKFWDYYTNNSTNKRFKNFWGSGLFRYVKDKIAIMILNEILSNNGFSKEQKTNAEILMNNFK
jgi:hypothetical protein